MDGAPDSQSDELQEDGARRINPHSINPPVALFPPSPLRDIALGSRNEASGVQGPVPVNVENPFAQTQEPSEAASEGQPRTQQTPFVGEPSSSDMLRMLVGMQQQIQAMNQAQQVVSMQLLRMEGQLDQQAQGAAATSAHVGTASAGVQQSTQKPRSSRRLKARFEAV